MLSNTKVHFFELSLEYLSIAMKKIVFLTMSMAALLWSSCNSESISEVQGYIPVYGTFDQLKGMVSLEASRSLNSPGKIYLKDQLLFVNESLKGVHVFDNTDPAQPLAMGFIPIPGNLDVAAKDQYLYADYQNGLLTVDISDIYNPKVMDYNSDYNSSDNGQLYPPSSLLVNEPSGQKVYFECPDIAKGLIIGWERSTMPQPQCYLQK